MQWKDRPYTFDRVVRIVITLLIATLVIYFISATQEALLPFLAAWLIAYLINPAVLFIQNKLKIKNKVMSITVVLLILMLVFTGILLLLIPTVWDELNKFTVLVNEFMAGSDVSQSAPQKIKEYLDGFIRKTNLLSQVSTSDAAAFAGKVFQIVWGIISESISLVSGFLVFFVTFLYVVFILKDYEKISSGAIELIPPRYRDNAVLLINDVKNGMNNYFRGQATVALFVGILLAIGFKIIDFPMAIMLGLFIGLLNLVPYLQFIGIIPMIIASILKSSETGGSFWVILGVALGVLLIVQIFQDTFLVPKIMGKVTGLNPAIILLSLSVWGVLLGFIGLIIALPITTILLSYYNRFILSNNKKDII